MQLNQNQQVLRGIWAKAAQEGRLELPPMDKAQATRIRFLLFREAKAMRAEGQQGLVDPSLLEDMGQLTCRMLQQSELNWQVSIEPKARAELIELGVALGIESSPTMGQQKVVNESLTRLNSLLGRPSSEPPAPSSSIPDASKTNPFYTREG